MALALRYAARSDVGLVRSENQDSGYAGPRLLVIADGMGGHAGGDIASSVTVAALAPLDEDSPGPNLLDRLAEKIQEANDRLRDMVDDEPRLSGMGTTVTAILRAGSRLGLVHVGDSRCYLMRDGELAQITRDDTFVQSLIDEGRISADEAAHHPQRSLITNALGLHGDVVAHLSIREAHEGDRYMLCSDGLSGVVSDETIAETLAEGDPEQVVDRLVDLALRGGGPDNVTCIVADVVEVASAPPPSVPQVVGAASSRSAVRRNGGAPSAAAKAAALSAASRRHADDEDDDEDDEPRRGRWGRRILALVLALAVLAAAGWGFWRWSQGQYYVAESKGNVAIYRGLSQSLGALQLSSVYQREDIALDSLPTYSRERLADAIDAKSLDDAQRIVSELRTLAAACENQAAQPTPTPTPTASSTPGASPAASAPAPAGASAPASPGAPTPSSTATAPTSGGGEGIDCSGSGS